MVSDVMVELPGGKRRHMDLLTPTQRDGAIKVEMRKAALFEQCKQHLARIAAHQPVVPVPAWMCGQLRELLTSGEIGDPSLAELVIQERELRRWVAELEAAA
jgi:hypothetical protein